MAAETSDTTATEAEGAPVSKPTSSARALKLAGAAAAAALAAGALVAVGAAASLPAFQASDAVELQTSSLITVSMSPETGCSNWEAIQIASTTACTVEECAQKCASSVGCQVSNFQNLSTDQCATATEGVEVGFCYLFKADCDMVPNKCWTLATPKRAIPVDPPTSYKEGMGCSNWASIQLDLSPAATRMECAQRCVDTVACVSMNFQGLPNDQCVGGTQGVSQNSCYLYGGTCVEEPNACWALGYMSESGSSNGPTQGSTIAATTTTDAVLTTV